MKKILFAAVALLGLASTGCPDKGAGAPPPVPATVSNESTDPGSGSHANGPQEAEPVNAPKDAEPVNAATATPHE